MSKASVIFNFQGTDILIQCLKEDKIKDICQKFATKIKRDLDSFIFLYGGNNLNFQLSFKDQANIIDKERNEMNVLVYKSESDELACPKCGEKIKLNSEKINGIKSSINNINDNIKGAKIIIENILKISSADFINVQLKTVNLIFNTLNEEVKKLNEKFDELLNLNNTKKESSLDNYILADIYIKDEDINKDIKILSSNEEFFRTNQGELIDNNIGNEDEITKCEIKINDEKIPFNYFYKFKSKGKYRIKYIFKNNLKSTCLMFGGCSSLTNIDLSKFNGSNVISMNDMFYECSSLKDINLSNFNTDNTTSMNDLFGRCSSLTFIDLSNFNTRNVTDMGGMFYGCSSLKDINLSNFNTNNVTNMNGMFYGCSSLNKIDLSNFNTNKVTNMGAMFYGCSSLKEVNLSSFNTNNATNMNAMFYGCSSLTYINLSNFNTINVTNMSAMFCGCSSLTNINLSHFNTNNVTDMGGMFYGCSSLNKIDLSNFNTNNVTNINYIFGDCPSLNKNNIIIKDKRIFNNETLFQKAKN